MHWCFESAEAIDARQLKRDLMTILRERGDEEGDFSAAELICGELVGNAKRHARGRITIELMWQSPHPVFSVHDENDSFLAQAELPADPWAQSGRGLYIVKRLARDFQVVDIVENGSKVVATLPVRKKVS